MATSFQKRARIKVGQIPGTRPSLHNNQLLVSTGIPSLDNVIGGGVAVGTVLLVEEDVFGSYSCLLLKYFVAEGIVSSQTVFLSSASDSPQELIQELPAPIEYDPEVKGMPKNSRATGSPEGKNVQRQDISNSEGTEEKMSIAWRYQKQPKLQSSLSQSSQFGHYYDLTRTMDPTTVEAAHVCTHKPCLGLPSSNVKPVIQNMNAHYVELYEEILRKIAEGQFSTFQHPEKRSILRIGLHSLGSPLWGESMGVSSPGATRDSSLTLFLIALRAALRTSLAVAMVTVPTHLFHDAKFVHHIRKMSDSVVRLESFAGSDKEKNPVFKEYHGLLHVVQLPRINSLIPPQPETSDLAFKLRRKKFTIERLHLPPELFDMTGRSQDDSPLFSKQKSSSSCGTSSSSKLSF